MVNFCPSCWNKNENNTTFCAHCWKNLKANNSNFSEKLISLLKKIWGIIIFIKNNYIWKILLSVSLVWFFLSIFIMDFPMKSQHIGSIYDFYLEIYKFPIYNKFSGSFTIFLSIFSIVSILLWNITRWKMKSIVLSLVGILLSLLTIGVVCLLYFDDYLWISPYWIIDDDFKKEIFLFWKALNTYFVSYLIIIWFWLYNIYFFVKNKSHK